MKPNDTDTRRLRSFSEVHRQLNVSPRTLRSLMAASAISFIRVSPRRIAFDPADVEAYIARQRSDA